MFSSCLKGLHWSKWLFLEDDGPTLKILVTMLSSVDTKYHTQWNNFPSQVKEIKDIIKDAVTALLVGDLYTNTFLF